MNNRNDDLILPFTLEGANVRGKLVRLGPAISEILDAHAYPQAIAAKLGEAIVLSALLGGTLKFDGKLILQTSTDGALNMMVANFTTPGDLRGYARFEGEGKDLSEGHLLGKGHLALTIDQGAQMERYQGVVELQGDDLAAAAHSYFERSEQIPTQIQLAAGPIITQGGQGWRAGGLLIQHMPGGAAEASEGSQEDWRRVCLLQKTTQAHEMLDPQLPAEQLLYRLFHEEGVKVFPPQPLRAKCGCSEAGVREMLLRFSAAERADMLKDDGTISVNCQFCNRDYVFDAAEFG
ncbi:MAG TPA: Hsp33 family molecular chaperone [Rhizobiales bacterium]|nr:Hsp33 family molecular chaperone [Hyphomicrobiales bacterium]